MINWTCYYAVLRARLGYLPDWLLNAILRANGCYPF